MSNFNKKYIEHCERRIQDILNDEREYSDWTQICFSMKDAIHAAVEVWGISNRKEGDLIPAYMSHELGEILPSMINISKSKIWDDWLQLTQYFPNRDSRYYEAAYVRYNAYDSPTEVYSGFGETEAESRAMLLFDLLGKKTLTHDSLNLKEVDRRKEYENEFE